MTDRGGPLRLGFLMFPGFPMACLTSAIEPRRAGQSIWPNSKKFRAARAPTKKNRMAGDVRSARAEEKSGMGQPGR